MFVKEALVLRGRSTRPEFWWVQLFMLGLCVAALLVDYLLFEDWIVADTTSFLPGFSVLILATAIPLAALGARRLHDLGLPVWPAVLCMGPNVIFLARDWSGRPFDQLDILDWTTIGLSALILIAVLFPSRPSTNRHGPNPHEVTP